MSTHNKDPHIPHKPKHTQPGPKEEGVVARIEADGPRSKLWEVMAGPGANKLPMSDDYKTNESLRETLAPKSQFLHFDIYPAATLLTFDPLQDHIRIQFINAETDQTLYDQTISQKT